MYGLLFLQQFLNGLQAGVMLFLMAAGLTLVFGIMDLINLAHGSLFMVGAYLCATVFQKTGSFLLGLGVALPGVALVGMADPNLRPFTFIKAQAVSQQVVENHANQLFVAIDVLR